MGDPRVQRSRRNAPSEWPTSLLVQGRLFPFASLGEQLDESRWVLDAEERGRAARFATRDLARRYERSHVALRLCLAHALGWEPAELRFSTGSAGKPVLAEAPPKQFDFSLSHSAEYAFVAWAESTMIGADIEEFRSLAAGPDLRSAVLSQEELALCAGAIDDGSLVRVWVVKEALLKATGEGLREAMTQISLEELPPAAPKLRQWGRSVGEVAVADWAIWRQDVGTQATWAIAVHHGGRPIELRWATWGQNSVSV